MCLDKMNYLNDFDYPILLKNIKIKYIFDLNYKSNKLNKIKKVDIIDNSKLLNII